MHNYVRKKHKHDVLHKIKISLVDHVEKLEENIQNADIVISYDKYASKIGEKLKESERKYSFVLDVDTVRIGSKYLSDYLYCCRRLIEKIPKIEQRIVFFAEK